ncbi:MAG TPA: hypothetical protein DCK83_00925 [Gallionellaceae bacterium]|nr:hypothetical protein [Gallionellaceae bacterium]
MDTRKKIDFAKLFLRSQISVLDGDEQEQRKRIEAILKVMRSEGYTYEQIAEFLGQHLEISVQPGQTRMAMQAMYQEALLNFIIAADRRDKACATCPLRTFPFSMELNPTTPHKE